MSDTVESSRLCLTPYRIADVPEVFDCITPAVTRYMSWEMPGSADELAARHVARQEAGTDEQLFVIRFRSSNRCLGVGGVHGLRAEAPELGLWLRADEHGRGLGTEAVRALATWASERLGSRRFVYPVAIENIVSRRIAERLGVVVTGRASGPKYDSVIYEIPWSPESAR